jgi:hypothetical protein
MIDIIAPPDKYFYTVDGKILTNVYQLLEYLINCGQGHYDHHVNISRNDFTNWLRDVFQLVDLARSVQSSGSKEQTIDILNKYFSDWEKKNSEEQNNVKTDTKKTVVINDIQPQKTESVKVEINMPNKNNNPATNFKEWSDEELEKFSKFGKPEREIPSEDEKVSYLKFESSELRNLIKDLRKSEKNTLIPDLLLRTVDSKIAYFALSKKKEDYDNIIKVFNDVKRELDYCSQEQPYSFADEIIKGLELQKVTMKKS